MSLGRLAAASTTVSACLACHPYSPPLEYRELPPLIYCCLALCLCRYALYTITSLAAVPASPTAAITGTPANFVATATEHVQTVTFQSRTPAYYICKLVA